MRETISVDQTVYFLNELLEIDSMAINALFSFRVSCNEKLAGHETVQVGLLGGSHPIVGLIGIINGLFGVDINKWGHISADYEDGKIIKFQALSEEQTTKLEQGGGNKS